MKQKSKTREKCLHREKSKELKGYIYKVYGKCEKCGVFVNELSQPKTRKKKKTYKEVMQNLVAGQEFTKALKTGKKPKIDPSYWFEG